MSLMREKTVLSCSGSVIYTLGVGPTHAKQFLPTNISALRIQGSQPSIHIDDTMMNMRFNNSQNLS